EAGLHFRPADAFDHGRLAADRVAVAGPPAVDEAAAGRFGDAQAGRQCAVADIAPNRCRSAAGAGAADDPGRLRMRFGSELADDRFGDVVVAAPVGRAFGQPELVEMAGTVGGMP